MAIPVSIVLDFLLRHKTNVYVVYIGMVLIIIGFLGFCISEFMHARREAKDDKNPGISMDINQVCCTVIDDLGA